MCLQMTTSHLFANAQELLRQMLGRQASFHDGQWQAIDAIVSQRKRVLVVQRTGWGKSLVYFLATKLLREQGAAPTLLVNRHDPTRGSLCASSRREHAEVRTCR